MKHIFSICTVLVLLVSTTVLSQSLLFQENFNYTPGQLTTVSGGKWVNFSGTGFFIQVSAGDLSYAGYNFAGTNDGKITLTATSASAEDVNRSFTAQTNTVYASMLVKVLDTVNLAANTSSSGEYFSGFLPTADNTNYIARLSIKKGTANTFKLGIRAGSAQSVTWASAEYVPGITYLVVFNYQFVPGASNDTSRLWINPSLSGGMPTPDVVSNFSGTQSEPVTDIAKLAFRQGATSGAWSATPNADIDKIRVATSWTLATQLMNTVTFRLNTCTRQDTIRPATALVQVRGDTPPLTWDNGALTMTNVGGDYWTATASFVNGAAIQYKYFASDWESTNNVNFTVTKDTVLPLAYYNNGFTPPYTPSDSIDVWFRINMGSQPSFNPATDVIGVRGTPAPLDWGTSIVLKQEGTTKFFSGVVRFPQSVAGTQIQHKFIIGTSGWESIDNRTWTVHVDTTLAWVTYNNAPIATVLPDTVRVTFMINTSTVPDTLLPISTVQVRGNTAPLTWDNTTGVNAVNVGGDYWKATAKFFIAPGQAIQYKFFTNSKSIITSTDNGWESNTTDPSGNHIFQFATFPKGKDTVLNLEYVNCTTSAQPLFWRPYVPAKDSVAVMFRINMQSLEGFNKAITKLGVRGSLAPLDWGKTIFLTEEQNDGNAGQIGYDGTNFWSAVVKFPRSAAATVAQYKFVQHAIADSAAGSPTWENIDNRTFNFVPAMADTTLYWKWWNNQIMLPFSGHDTVIITFRADLAKAISGNGFVYGDTLVVRSGYISSAVALREKKMLRVGTSSKYQVVDTVTTKLSTYLFYQYYKTPVSGEIREIYFNFADPGTSAESEKRRFTMSAKTLTIQDTINSTSAEHRMPLFQNMKHLAQNMVVTYTCDVRPAIYQLKKGSKLISTNITNYVISNPDSVKYYGVWMDGPAVGGWDVGGAWGADRRLVDTAKMWDDGTHGDLVAHDSIYTLRYSYTTSATVGQEFKFGIYGCDNEGGYGNNHIENINDANATATIASQFGSIDPVFFNAWDFTNQKPATTGVQRMDGIPLAYTLNQNYPNPFNPSTKIDYSIKAAGFVSLKVFNLLGQVVATLTEGKQEAGNYSIMFDASRISSGIYFYQLTAGNFVATKKMMFLK